jgi:hypothetical protein
LDTQQGDVAGIDLELVGGAGLEWQTTRNLRLRAELPNWARPVPVTRIDRPAMALAASSRLGDQWRRPVVTES